MNHQNSKMLFRTSILSIGFGLVMFLTSTHSQAQMPRFQGGGMPAGMAGRPAMPSAMPGMNRPSFPTATKPVTVSGGGPSPLQNMQIQQQNALTNQRWQCIKCKAVVASGARPTNMTSCPSCGASTSGLSSGSSSGFFKSFGTFGGIVTVIGVIIFLVMRRLV